ncbi:MAG: MerR family transcriptional regulator [Pseudomonadota bacterium]
MPDKIYFKIGEVSQLLSIEPHVIRYWETEFPVIKPIKSKSGQRLFRRSDIEVLNLIKDLLYGRKFTIEGARRHLKSLGVDKSIKEKEKRDQTNIQLTLKAVKDRVGNLNNMIERFEKKLIKDF